MSPQKLVGDVVLNFACIKITLMSCVFEQKVFLCATEAWLTQLSAAGAWRTDRCFRTDIRSWGAGVKFGLKKDCVRDVPSKYHF